MRHALTALAAVFALSLFSTGVAGANDRLDLSFTSVADGSCYGRDNLPTFELTYTHESDTFDARGNVRQAPSGVDCANDNLAYNVELERRFDVWQNWDGVAKIGADRHTWKPEYAHTSGTGRVWTISSGPVDTITAVAGMGTTVAGIDFLVGYNFVPTEWCDGECFVMGDPANRHEENTWHVAVGTTFDGVFSGALEIAADIDFDAKEFSDRNYGSVRVVWHRELTDTGIGFNLGVHRDWGLTTTAPDGRPLTGAELTAIGLHDHEFNGTGQDDATRITAGISVGF